MIAQPILTTASTAKAQAHQQLQQQQQQNVGGFQSLLSTTDSSLSDLAQNTGASGTTTPQPANANKPKSNDPTATPYVAAHFVATPTQPTVATPNQPASNQPGPAQLAPTVPVLPSDGKTLDASAIPNSAVIPASDPSTAAAATADSGASNGNSTSFGADALNARIVAGAPIYASQPNASMATVPPHLLDAANPHPLPGEPVGKPGDDTTGKTPVEANATMAPSTANATNAAPQFPPLHPAVTAPNASNSPSNGDSPAQTADNGNATAPTGGDPTTSSASLLAQPTAPQAAPVQIDAAVHTAAPYVPVGEQVALNLKQAIAADNNEIRIQLKPASLGTIDVKLNVGQDGRVNAVISADRSDTLNMLKQDSGTLQQALRDAGLNADSSSLSFNLRGDTQSFAQNWSQGGGGNSGGGNSYASSASDALLGADTVAPAQRVHSGALDIEV